MISFKQMQVKDFTTRKEYGVIVGNPPYGERLGEKDEVQKMYREMGQAFADLDTWSIYMLTSEEHLKLCMGKGRQRNVNCSMGLFVRITINTGGEDHLVKNN